MPGIQKREWYDTEFKEWIRDPNSMDEQYVVDISVINTIGRITVLPDRIGNLTNLEKFFFSYNGLTSLPESFGNLTNLTKLVLDNNKLTTLPESFGNLTKLQQFSLADNKITSLPESFGNLTNLTELNLNTNRLRSLPESFGNLTNLKNLELDNNQLTTLPESFGNVTNLMSLYLRHNKITSLPESFGKLINLKHLILSDNRLKSLPKSIKNLRVGIFRIDLNPINSNILPLTIGTLRLHITRLGNYEYRISKTSNNVSSYKLPVITPIVLSSSDIHSFTGVPAMPVYDPVMGGDVAISEYLADEDNVVFIFNNNASGYPKSQLKNEYFDGSAVAYECKKQLGLAVAPNDVHMDRPYYRLKLGFGMFLIPVSDFMKIVGTTHQIFELKADKKLPYTAGRRVISEGMGRTIDGHVLDLVGMDHCSAGTDKMTYTATPIKIGFVGGYRSTQKRSMVRKGTRKGTGKGTRKHNVQTRKQRQNHKQRMIR